MNDKNPRILYCRCAFAKVVPQEIKDQVLERLCDSGVPFDCVSDLCEMSARKDPQLEQISNCGQPVKIAACYERAVKWLFHSAGVPFPEGESSVEVLNMREQSADEIMHSLLDPNEQD